MWPSRNIGGRGYPRNWMSDSTVVTFNPWEPGFFDDPYRQYAQLRADDPVHRSPLEVWVLFRYDDVVRVLRDPALSVDIANATPNLRMQMMQAAVGERLGDRAERGARAMLGLDPPDHTRLRRLVSKAFTPRTVENLRPDIVRLTDELLDGFRGVVDIIPELALPLPMAVIGEMLGIPAAERAALQPHVRATARLLEFNPPLEEIDAAARSSKIIAEHLEALIAQRRAEPTDDLLSELVH